MATNSLFKTYMYVNKPEYFYTIKLAVPEITDSIIDSIETSLSKYSIKVASEFRRKPIQENPLDFPNIKNMPVHIADIILEYPASLDMLRSLISDATGISLQQVAVYSENDPREIETDLFLQRRSPEHKKNYKPFLGRDYDKTDYKLYGDEYNMELLKELENERKSRELKVTETPLSKAQVFDHSVLPKDYHSYTDSSSLPKGDVGLFGRVKKINIREI